MVDPPIEVDPRDPATWVEPVSVQREKTPLCHLIRIEYVHPMTPNALIVAMLQLPPDVPKTNPTFVRTMPSKSNISRDGRHKGGFIIELAWPLGDIKNMPMDTEDEPRAKAPVKRRRRTPQPARSRPR